MLSLNRDLLVEPGSRPASSAAAAGRALRRRCGTLDPTAIGGKYLLAGSAITAADV